ncbi:MAG TPA: penicillin-binding protein 2 [Gaiellaceae bacterium]|nr:penicillin-binding protein 2 [Gaiellaceae bacterium]
MSRRRGQAVDRRIRLLLAVLTVAFAATLGRAVWVQAVRAEPLARMAQGQQRETVVRTAARGTIYDRTGSLLAIGERATTVWADPRQITEPRAVARMVARELGVDADALAVKLADRSRGFVYVARKADPARAARVAALRLDGVGFLPEERRTYPQRSVGAHVLGYAGTDNTGLAGLERALDPVLAGRPGSETVVRDPFGRVIDVLARKPERNGRDVYLTLDHTIQAQAEAVLRDTVRTWGARAASAIVLDPENGEILAMAVAPGFDANRFGAVPVDRTRNRSVTDVYEPGSTFKLVTVAGVLSEGLVTPSTSFTLPYELHVADRVIHDSHPRKTERMSVAQILSHSSNVGTVTLAQLLGRNAIARWIERFGFGRRTGIDFPGESRGIVLPPERWSGSTIGNVPIGQGIGVTPLQMASAYAAIANGGVLVQPHLVSRVGAGGPVVPKRRRVVSPGVAATLKTLLRGVVDEGGTGTAAAITGYYVAGKTGTAQKPEPTGGYSSTRYVASFVGFVPATKPRLVVLVNVDEPKGSIWGGVVAAPAFQHIARFALQYLEVPPDAPLVATPD